jgi:hypothetical protein
VPNFDALAIKKEEFVRRATDGSVFRGPLSADHIDVATLFSADGSLKVLPTEYKDLGLLNDDGASIGREVNSTDITAFGRNTPVRSDIISDVDSFGITAIETKLETIEFGTGATLSAGSRSSTTGALEIRKPPRPTTKQYHFLVLAVDTNQETGSEIYLGRYFPKGKITGYGDQVLLGGDGAIGWNATVQAQMDSEWGASSSWLFGGPGWNELLVDMGFTAYTPAP